MSDLPKLKIRSLLGSEPKEDICDLEQAKQRLDYESETIVLVEGHMVNSHEKLVQVATQERYKDKEFLEVVLLPLIAGG